MRRACAFAGQGAGFDRRPGEAFDEDAETLLFGKTLSTPDHLVRGIDTGIAKAGTAFTEAALFLHGATIAANTILERAGAKTALITTEGFRDVYEIGRIDRPDSYNMFFQKHEPLVERAPLRGERARSGLRRGRMPARRRRGRGARPRHRRMRHGGGRDPVPALLPQPRARDPGEGGPGGGAPPFVRLGFPRAVPEVPGVRAHVDRRRERLYRRDRGSPETGGLRRIVPDGAVDGRVVRGRTGAELLRADARIRPGGRRDRRSGSRTRSPSTWAAPRPRPG